MSWRLPARLFDKIMPEPNTGCWLWVGALKSDGYGSVWEGARRTVGAHRLVYELLRGPIPVGLSLDHLCRVPSCVNPDHLEPVTHRVNVLRGASLQALNARKTHCPNGHPYDARDRGGGRRCATCTRERRLAHYAANRERERARQSAYRETNRERERERLRRYRARKAQQLSEVA